MKLAGAAACLLSVAVWLGSGRVHCSWASRRSYVQLGSGCLVTGDNSTAWGGQLLPSGVRIASAPPDRQWAYRWWFGRRAGPGPRVFWAPLWTLALPLAGAAAWAWRRDSRARAQPRGYCHACGYDRRGLDAAGPCPECGATPARPLHPEGTEHK